MPGHYVRDGTLLTVEKVFETGDNDVDGGDIYEGGDEGAEDDED